MKQFASTKPKDANESLFHFCQERRGWWCVSFDGLLMLLTLAGLVGLIIACITLNDLNALNRQAVINQSGQLGAGMTGAYITTNVPVVFTLPADLSAYVGKTYHIDCAYAGHKVEIAPGGAVWNALNQLTATCAAAGSGLTFRVVAKDRLRVISTINVVFS